MRIPVAIYPYCSELLPAVKFFEKMQDKYFIARLFSPPGLGLGGKDASYSRNQPNIGHIVEDKFDADEPSWNVLFLIRVNQPDIIENDKIIRIAESTLSAGKKVIYFDNCKNDVPNPLWLLSESRPNEMTIITEDMQSLNPLADGSKYRAIGVPVILIGGLTAAEDSTEVLFSLADSLSNQGFKATIASSGLSVKVMGEKFHCINHIIKNNSISEVKKIELINSHLANWEKMEIPDIILMEAPDSVMRYRSAIPHGFGIYTYMLCQAVKPDYFVCCIPFDLAEDDFIAEISIDLSYRLGSAIDAVHISNVIIDSVDAMQSKQVSHAHGNLSAVRKRLEMKKANSEIPVFDVVSDGADGLLAALLNQNN
ncbi:MAG: hypothetical protein FWG91_11575 [Lachnospiraceae bacterium]|nr:hypothetical protein [Lachnospiraceae bacterium]